MNCSDFLRSSGLDVGLVGLDRLKISPADQITPEIREYIKDHKCEIINELRGCPIDTPMQMSIGTIIPDPFLAQHHILIHLESVGDVWLTSDEQASRQLASVGLPVLLESDVRYILQVEGHEARLARLREIYGRRHPLTQTVLQTFTGSRITSTKERNLT